MATKICNTSLPLAGNPGCTDINNFGVTSSLYFTTSDFSFSSVANFADETKWKEGIRDGYILPVQDVMESEDQSEETKYYDSPIGYRLKLRNGKYRDVYKFQKNFEVHKKLFSLSNQDLKLFKVDINGNVLGVLSGSTVVGFSTDMVNVEKLRKATPEMPAWSIISVQESDPTELNSNGIVLTPEWSIGDLDGIVEIVLVDDSHLLDEWVVTVYAVCGYDSEGAAINIPIVGLLVGSFNSTVTDIDSIVDNLDGSYTIVATSGEQWFATCTMQVLPTTTALYKSNIITLT